MHTNAQDIAAQAALYCRPRIHFPSDTPTRATSDRPAEHDRQNVTIRPDRRAPQQTAWNDDADTWPTSLQQQPKVLRIWSITPDGKLDLRSSLHPAPTHDHITIRDLEDAAWRQWEQRAHIQGVENANIPIMVELLQRPKDDRKAPHRTTLIHKSKTAIELGF